MVRFVFLLLTLLGSASVFAQKSSTKIADANGFLRDILGAKYAKSDKRWTLPNTRLNRDTFGVEANGGLFVTVDTIVLRDVGPAKEAWVLFTVEGYMFNFARLEKTENAWVLKFEPSDKNSNPFIKCKGSEVVVWDAEKGYLVGDSIVVLNDPMDEVPVSSKCDL